MSSILSVKQQGVKGGSPSYAEKGRATLFIDEPGQLIAVDAFDGFGKTYKRRERCFIEVSDGSGNVWTGTFEDLSKLLFHKQ